MRAGFGQMEAMIKKVYRENGEGIRARGRPQRRWKDEMKEVLMEELSEKKEKVIS